MVTIEILAIFLVLYAWKKTRKLALYLIPWALFGIIYDNMRWFPNYDFNPIDIRGLYDTEKHLFGIMDGGKLLIPGEYFAIHHCAVADFFAGLFYLCWVPVPIAFGVYLLYKKEYNWYSRFSWCFLFVNILGFIGYYIHPAAAPWYAMNFGFTPKFDIPGNVAGLARFDQMVGLPIFHSIYVHNSNVFAAIPSLHSAYMLVATCYAYMSKRRWPMTVLFGIIQAGIWCTAVYTGHHYVIDVLLGILTGILGVVIFETGYRKIKKIKK